MIPENFCFNYLPPDLSELMASENPKLLKCSYQVCWRIKTFGGRELKLQDEILGMEIRSKKINLSIFMCLITF